MFFNNHKNCDSKQRFSIRKLSIGACSVLLSTLFLAMNNPQVVHADNNSDTGTDDGSANSSQTDKSEPNEAIQGKEVTLSSNDSATSKNDETETGKSVAQTNDANTNATGETADNNKQKASEEKGSSDANSDTQKNNAENKQPSTSESDKSAPKANADNKDGETVTKTNGSNDKDKNTETTTLDLKDLNGKALDPNALKDSKVKTTNGTVDWSQNRYFYAWDQQGHPEDWWKNLIDQKFLPWILKQSDNEGATLESVSWTDGMTGSSSLLTPSMAEGPADNRFGYPHATVVVKNANGSTTTYTGVTINMAKSFASYIRAKWGISSNGDLSDNQSATTVNITTHAGATGDLGATSVTKIRPYNWDYTGEYMQSLISSVELASGTTLTTDTKNANVTLKFTDGSSIVAPNASVTVLGGQAQTGLTVAKGGNFAFAYPNATSGITSTSQSQIAQWTPTYDWVFDQNGTPLDASHQYNTNANFNAYVKITYHKDGQADGTQIVKVPVNVNEHTLAQQYGTEIFNHIDYITSHPISAGLADSSTSSSWSADKDPSGKQNLNPFTWGIDPYQIVWKSGTTDAQKAQYKKIISSLITSSEHSFPVTGSQGTFAQGYIVGPGVTLFFTDGSCTGGGDGIKAHIYKPTQTPGQTTFKAGDLSQFDSASAATHVDNVLPSGDSSFDVTYQWVVKDPNSSYTFSNAINMNNTNQWVTKTNNQWGVANPNNATGTKGVTITGYRALKDTDIQTTGNKEFYVLVGYTKNGKSGSTNGTYDGYYVVPQEVTITLKDEIDIKVSGNGTQTETYNGSAYSLSDLDLNEFKPSFTDESDNSPITNLTPTKDADKLTPDDYLFEQNGSPRTDALYPGKYGVYLKLSGINKIKNWAHASNYNWSDVPTIGPGGLILKVGTFTIAPAKASATLSGSGQKTYDGSAVSDANIQASDANNDIKLSLNVPTITNPSFTLTANSFDWYATDAQGNKTGEALKNIPSAAGKYYLELNSATIAAIKHQFGDKFTWTDGAATDTNKDNQITGHAIYTITQVTSAKIDQKGSTSKTYDGKAASVALSTLTNSSNWSVSGLINSTDSLDFSKLTADDFDWYLGTTDLGKLSATNIDQINKGTVGNYTIKLNSAGITALQNANPNYVISNSNVSGGYSYDITQAEATATLSGSNNRKYNGSAVTTTDLNNGGNITVTISIPNSTKTIAYTLQDGDYTWQTTGNVAPTNASTTPYTLKLNTDNILAHLQSTISGDSTWKDNVKIAATDLNGSASFTINNATATAKNMTGSYTITYGDTPDFSKASEAYTVHLTTDPTTITAFDSYKLTNGSQLQFRKHGTTDAWSATIPTAAGTYDVILSNQGWNDLKGANSNVQVNGTGSTNLTTTATFTINSKVTFEFVDDDNKDAQGKPTVVGTPQSQGITLGATSTINPALTVPNNYVLANTQPDITLVNGKLPTEYTLASDAGDTKTVKIHLVHKTSVETVNEIRTATVNYVYGNGDKIGQTAHAASQIEFYYKGTKTTDLVTNKATTIWTWDKDYSKNGFTNGYHVVSGTWTVPDHWDNVVSEIPTVDGYTAFADGDWRLNKNGTLSSQAANIFTYPTYTNAGTSEAGRDQVSYSDAADTYESMANHTIYYVQNVQQTRTVTEHYRYWKNGQDAGEAAPDAKIDVYFQNIPTAFSTNKGSTDPTQWKATYGTDNKGNWKWNTALGDADTPGLHVESGTWNNLGSHGSPMTGESFSVAHPDITGYTTVTLNTAGNKNSYTFYQPGLIGGAYGDLFANNTASDWYARNELTTYYVPTSELQKLVTRTINITEPGKATATTVQPSSFYQYNLTRNARITNDNKGVVLGYQIDSDGNVTQDWSTSNESNGWSAYTIPSHSGYTVNITQTVTKADGTTIVTHPTSIDAVTVNGSTLPTTINITYTASATAKLSGSASSTYNGSAISWDDVNSTAAGNNITVTVTGPNAGSYKLQQGDVEFSSDNGQTWKTALPTDAGTYQIRWTTDGIKNIKDHFGNNSITWGTNDADINGSATYTIKKADITVSGNGSQSADYDGSAFGKDTNGDVTGLDLSKFVPSLSAGTTANPITTPTIPANTLTAADFTIENQDGTANANPTKVGTYKVYLNTDGIAKLQGLTGASNFNWPTEAVQVGTFKINTVSAKATISSSTGRTYDGKATTSSDLNATVSITVPGETSPISYTLVDGDYTWNTTDHAAPINASDTAYTITLTKDGVDHLQAAINDKIGAGNVTIANTGVTNKVSYKINKATATVNFANGSGQTVPYTGQTGKFDANKFTPTISTNNDQTLSIPSGVNLSLANGDFTINGVETTTEPTALGTYTIGLSDTGFAKLQSATNNYNWVNNAKASYIIKANDQETVTVTNKADGGQKVVYKDANYGTNDIDLNDYQLTLPTGLSYTLQAGDLEIVPNTNGNTTTVGTYTVQLSQKGKDHLVAAGGNNFKFDFTKPGVANTSATFEITKATPTVVFNGVGSKTYGQNDTNWTTPTGLTITAPSNPTIALTAEDYEFVDSKGNVYTSIPTNAGTYTVRLSTKGKSLITGSTDNSANLDWANANVSGTGTFTVKAAEAKAELSGTNSRDYNGSAVTTTDINNGGTITVTISIPNGTKTINYKLQNGDYTWKDNANTTNVGTYTIELNKANILAHLQDKIANDSDWKGNVTLADTALLGTATFTVNAKAANVSLSGDNGNGVTYNGKAVSTPLDALKNALSASGTINNAKLDLTGLTTAGFDWYDAAGTNKISAPTDHGTYTIKLNDTGLQQIQDKNSNYTVSIATPNAYTFKINTAKGSVAFDGSRTVAFGTDDSTSYFNGYTATLTTNPSTITGFSPSFTLKAGDLQFSSDNGRNWSTTVPTNVGTYQVKLSDAARNRIVQDNNANGNIDWPATGFTGVKTYTITPAQATASLSGSAKRPYNGSAVTTGDINNADSTIGVTINLPNNKTTTYKLVDGDYTWVDGSAPTNVGTYQLKFNLTEQGKTNLQNWLNKADVAGTGLNGKPNVTAPTEVTGNASFKITPVTITVTESGSGSKTYDGNAANVAITDLTNSNNWSESGMIGGQSFNLPSGLELSDFDWYKVNADNSESKINAAPTDAGNYALKLNAYGLKKLQDANTNYSFSAVSGQYNYVINQANAEISLNENTNKQSATWDGSQISLDLSKFKPAIKDTSNNKDISYPSTLTLTAIDYKITQNGQTATAQEPGTYQIQLTEQGWQKIRDAISGHDNYKWTYSGNGVLTIGKKSQAITISGSNNVVYSGSSAVIPTDDNGNLTGYTVNLGNGLTYQLKTGDLAFVDADHTNVGSYKLQLTEAGLENINKAAQGSHYNYQYTYDANNTATLTVDPATATYTLSGSQNSIYNGSPASIDLNKDNSYSITITMNNNQTVTYQLQAGDLAFKSGSNPTTRGRYDVVLSAEGLNHLKAINANYTWDVDKSTSTAFYEINPAEMFVGLGGETDSVFNNAIQPVPTDKLGNLHIVWGGNSTKPSDVANTISIQAGDFDYYTKNADGSFTKVDPTKGPKDAGHYYLFLNDAGLKRLSDANPNGNYTFAVPTEQNSKNAATYTINQLAAKVTLTGEQTAEYGYAQVLNQKNYSVVLKDKDGTIIGTVSGNDLQVGDLLINGYTTTDGHPTDVGTYAVEIQNQLIKRLKQDFPNFNFDAVIDKGIKSDGTSGSVTDKNNNGIYVITTIDANIAINGSQEVPYNSKNSYSIDNSKYSVKLTDKRGNEIAIPDSIKNQLKFKFVTDPTNAGNYEVTLTDDSITLIEGIGTNNSNHLNNYAWHTDDIKAQPYVVTPLQVTATVSNKGTEPASSIYGNPINLDDHLDKYTITLVDETTHQSINYALQRGDLEFVNGIPTTTGEFAVQLSQAGIANIEKQYPTKNYTITFDHTATYNVIAATPTVTITANGNSQKTYNAQPAEIKSGDFTISITTNNGQTITTTLSSNDLEFDGSVPTNAGQYDVKLKQSAIDQLKHDHPNYDWDAVKDAVGKYTITAADGSAKLSGDVTKPYDGSGISDLSPIKVTVDYPGVGSNTTYTLTNDDYVIVNDQTNEQYKPSEAPADVGSYHIELTDTGKANIAKLGNTTEYRNINWTDQSYSGKATYTITAISIAVSGQGKQDVTYDGTAFGNADKLDVNKFKPTLNAGTVGVPSIPAGTLTADDYTIKSSKGETVTDPTNAGEYAVWLNENGLKKLKNLSSNFTWPTDPIKVGTLNIGQTDVTAKLSGSNSKTYDGKAVSTQDINKTGGNVTLQVTVNGKTYDYALQNGDYTWANGEAPTNVGEYTDKIVLDTTGNLVQHLTDFINGQNKDLEGNFKIDAKNLTGSASFNITKKDATVTQSGSDDTKTYNGTAGSVTLDQLINNLTSSDLVSGQNLNTSGLTLDDFAWSGTDPNHIAAGDYTIALTEAGLKKLQKDNPNYNISVKGSFAYTIKQATASAELSGSGEKTYNGDPVSNADIQKLDQDNNITVKVTIPGESTPQTVTLGVNDFAWSGGKVPTAAGTYTITLNDAGKAAIKQQFADNKNIDWTKTSFTGSATYTIKKADGTISFTGSDGKDFDNKEVKPSDLDGKKIYVTINGQQFSLPENGVEFVDKDGNKVTPKNARTYYVVLTDQGLADLEKDTNYSWTPNWNGTTRPNEIGTYVINKAKVDPTIGGSNSKPYDGKAVTAVEVNKDGKISVTVKFGDETITIPSGQFKEADYSWLNADGSKRDSAPSAVGKYIVKLSSDGLTTVQNYLDQKYGKDNIEFVDNGDHGQADFEITAVSDGGDDGNGGGDNKPTPEPQPTNQPTDAKPTKPSDQKPEKPGNKPSKPTQPSKPSKPNKGKPAKPGKKPSKGTTVKPGQTNKRPNKWSENNRPSAANTPKGSHWVNGELIGPSGETLYKNGHWTRVGRQMLPQTGENDSLAAAILGSLATGLSIFGLAGTRKKKDDE